MSGATWFIGDLHFGHEKVAGLRGFADTITHDKSIIHQWRKQVQAGDLVHILGDLSSGSRTGESHALNILMDLPGRKRLIAGNHDSVSGIHRTVSPHLVKFNAAFERVTDFARIRVNAENVLLSHYPYTADHMDDARYMQYRLPDLGLPLIHAHTHSAERTAAGPHQLCVSWEAWGRMVNMGDVAAWLADTP